MGTVHVARDLGVYVRWVILVVLCVLLTKSVTHMR